MNSYRNGAAGGAEGHHGNRPFVFLIFAAVIVVSAASAIRPLPFAMTDDNWMYFLPLLKAQTDALLSGHWLSINWHLGPGWTPWESGQAGVLYFPYLVAAIVARSVGAPLALLDISAALHIAAAGVIAYRLLPDSFTGPGRLLVSLLCQFPAGPLILGLNWHNYLTPLPWILAIGLLVIRHSDGAPWTRLDRVGLLVASVLFFAASHVQVYVFGMTLLGVWALVVCQPRARFHTGKWLVVTQLPAVFPLLYLKLVSLGANPDWFAYRDSTAFALRHAQYLSTVLQGTIWGNFLFTSDFRLWSGIDWRGIGMFFSPGLLLGVPDWIRGRHYGVLVFFGFGLLLMGIATAPALQHLFVGPFAGFRWTWKFAALFGPLAILTYVRYRATDPKPFGSGEQLFATILVLASLGVFLRGTSFDILPSLSDVHKLGPSRVVEETRSMAASARLPSGARIAVIGQLGMSDPLPVPILGLLGNAPILSGLETAHIYEPMEPGQLLRDHLGLTLPWRGFISEVDFFSDLGASKSALRSVGVQAAVTISPMAASIPGSFSFTDTLGRTVYVIPIPGATQHRFPDTGEGHLQRLPDGRLAGPPGDAPPDTLSSRKIDWAQQPDGSWIGKVRGFGSHWAFGTAFLFLVSLIICAGIVRRRMK